MIDFEMLGCSGGGTTVLNCDFTRMPSHEESSNKLSSHLHHLVLALHL